jgi:hypothetical protein
MLDKLKALMSLFKQGAAVADPAKWKNRQISVTMLAGLIIAIVQLAKAFGHEIPVDSETAMALAGGVIAAVNTIFTITTSKAVGLPTGTVATAEQTVPSVQQATPEAAQAENVPSEPVPDVGHRGIDETTRERAKQWAKQQTSNGLANDA